MVSSFGTRVRRILFQETEFNGGGMLASLANVTHPKKQRRSKRTKDVPSVLLTSIEQSLSFSEGILGSLFTEKSQQDTKPRSPVIICSSLIVSQCPPRKRQRKSLMGSVLVSALIESFEPPIEISKIPHVVPKGKTKRRAIAATEISTLVVKRHVKMASPEKQNKSNMADTLAVTVSNDDDNDDDVPIPQEVKLNSNLTGSKVFDEEEIQPCILAIPCRIFSPQSQGKWSKELESYTNKTLLAKRKTEKSTTRTRSAPPGVVVKKRKHSIPPGEESSSMETAINMKKSTRTLEAASQRDKQRRYSIPLATQSRRSGRQPLPINRYFPDQDRSNNSRNKQPTTILVEDINNEELPIVVQPQHKTVVKPKRPSKIHPVSEETTSKKRRLSMPSLGQSRRSGRQLIPTDRYIPAHVPDKPATSLTKEIIMEEIPRMVQQRHKSRVEKPSRYSEIPVEEDVSLWSHEQVNALREAQSMANPMSCSFWSYVAGHVEGKSESDCRAKWFSLVQTPNAKVKQQGKLEKLSLEDDLFHATPMRGGILMNFDVDVGSPIVDTTTRESGEFRVEANYCYDEIMVLKQRVGYKTYLKGLRREVSKGERDRRLNRARTVKRNHGPRILSERVERDGIEMKCNLTPGGTIRIHTLTEEENDDDCFFNVSDEE
jgi:hypothetical protein